MTTAYIGIGSNVGDRQAFCRRAVDALSSSPGVHVTATSSLYETSPLGGPPQRSFINMVVRVETDLNARGLLKACQAIEKVLGREPSDIRWGPRVLDLDILLYGEEKIVEPDLEIPHPRLSTRRFALVPLLEIDPEIADPREGRFADSLPEAEGDVDLAEPY